MVLGVRCVRLVIIAQGIIRDINVQQITQVIQILRLVLVRIRRAIRT